MEDLLVRIRADVSGLMNGLRQARTGIAGLDKSTKSNQRSLAGWMRVAAGSTAALGLGKLIKDSVTLEANYSKTMAQIAVATNAPKTELKALDALALKMGKDTVFSAQDAADAMLELGKGGLSVAQIKAGALAQTMTLAAAGGIELGDAANTVVQAMGAFGLKADQANIATAALAGGANASSASLDDMVQALRQTGTVANSAGLSIQETTGMLALLADQGIKGSDAGTSLRTMLSRLVPNTKSAAAAMKELNLSYVDGNGNMVDAQEIARRTQKAFKGLSDEERSRAIQTIFGQDAQRAVNALIKEGAGGLEEYIKQTSDLTQAEKLRDAAMSGTKGALEQLRGSVETAQIQFGKGLAPTIRWAAKEINEFVSSGDMEKWGREAGQGVQSFVREAAPLAKSLFQLGREAWPLFVDGAQLSVDILEGLADVVGPVVDAFNKLPDAAQKAILLGGGIGLLARRADRGGLAANLAAIALGSGQVGNKAGGAAPQVNTFGTSLKRLSVITAGLTLGGVFLEELDQVKRGFRDLGPTAKSTQGILKQFQQGNISKLGGELDVDMKRLADSIRRGGDEGLYFQAVLERLDSTASGWAGSGQFVDLITYGFGNQAAEAKTLAHELRQLAAGYKGTGDAAGQAKRGTLEWNHAVNSTLTSLRLSKAGIDDMNGALLSLPNGVVTQITTPGAIKSKQDVVALARQYNLTPKQVETIMKALGTTFSKKQIQDVIDYLKAHDGDTGTVRVKAETKAAYAAVRSFYAFVNSLPGVSVNMPRPALGSRANRRSPAGIRQREADGGVVDYFGRGGFKEKHVAQIAPRGSIRIWNEPETGGEAYIPLHPDKRARSMHIWRETGARLGVQGFADGGLSQGDGGRRRLHDVGLDYRGVAGFLADEIIAGLRGSIFELKSDARSLQLKAQRGM